MTKTAAAIRIGVDDKDDWKAWALPWNDPCSVCGTFSSSCNAWIFATASPSETPGETLNDSVTEGNWP